MKLKDQPIEALKITLATLYHTKELHYRSCYEDVSCRPLNNIECVCPIRKTMDQLLKEIKRRRDEDKRH